MIMNFGIVASRYDYLVVIAICYSQYWPLVACLLVVQWDRINSGDLDLGYTYSSR